MEWAEARIGPLHYKTKAHTILTTAYELAIHQSVLDAVEALIGPDILLYNVGYLVNEPHSPAHVSCHRNLTYWRFNAGMWLHADGAR